MHHPTDRIAHTTAFVTPVVVHWLEREHETWLDTHQKAKDTFWYHQSNQGCYRYTFTVHMPGDTKVAL